MEQGFHSETFWAHKRTLWLPFHCQPLWRPWSPEPSLKFCCSPHLCRLCTWKVYWTKGSCPFPWSLPSKWCWSSWPFCTASARTFHLLAAFQTLAARSSICNYPFYWRTLLETKNALKFIKQVDSSQLENKFKGKLNCKDTKQKRSTGLMLYMLNTIDLYNQKRIQNWMLQVCFNKKFQCSLNYYSFLVILWKKQDRIFLLT